MQTEIEKKMYAIVDASTLNSQSSAKKALLEMVSAYGREYFDGVMISQYGANEVMFIELLKKEGPIVDILGAVADKYNLYPVYLVEEHKDYMPRFAKYERFIVDQAVMQFDNVNFAEWRQKFVLAAKEIYRNDHVFIKAFVYENRGVIRVMMHNSERDPMYRGSMLGVPQWHDAITKLAKELGGEPQFRTIRYANF